MKKTFYILVMLLSFLNAEANDKTVTLITSGQGKTQDEAKQNALRNAIEQAFGAFISSHTEIVNDNLVKDEIISVSNGNIQKYEIISESALPDNLGYTATLKTIVSISKLTSFCESKGMQIEIKGSLFAFNVIQKELSASNEKKALEELVLMAKNIAPKMFDYTITANEPIKNEITDYSRNRKKVKPYCLPIKVNITINKNWEEYRKTLEKTLSGLAISKSELEDYKKLNISYYPIDVFTNKKMYNGKYEFTTSNRKTTQQKFDEDYLKYLRRYETSPQSYPVYSTIASGFDKGNYNISNLYFRTNIGATLYFIDLIIRHEAFNYKIQNQSGNEINSKIFTVLFSPMSLPAINHERVAQSLSYHDRDKYRNRDIISSKSITYEKDAFQKKDMYGIKSEILKEKSIILQQIKSGTIIGYGYCTPLFDLEEIKTLNKLEVKHR